ncbi:MAG: 2-hydroxyhepta-2,4-diene-1,7-dioate isomerase [Bacteroidetes bacterium GWE2_29_8]|nr:MAG: 2-hydroxyhepta-2,4-diene-1,7-dioate isomerase [Bacteroidetes bacterium GWE2_29_8]
MKIICIGRNYIDHIKELNSDIPKSPVIFIKPETAIIRNNLPFFIPDFSNDIHYETELVIKISRLGKYINEKYANEYYQEIGIGIDFTARDIQRDCIKNGLPWEISKSFDSSAPISNIFINKNEFANLNDINFHLLKNGELVQKGNTKDMIFKFDYLISYISQYFTLKIGDLIFTGTPVGVGKVNQNDILEAFIGDRELLQVKVK